MITDSNIDSIDIFNFRFRDAIPYGIFMFVYEYLVEKMRAPHLVGHYKEPSVESWRTAAASACAGMLSWLPGIPFDVIKTKMMTATDPNQYKNVWHCFRVITKVSEWWCPSMAAMTMFMQIKQIIQSALHFRSMVTGIYSGVARCWSCALHQSVLFHWSPMKTCCATVKVITNSHDSSPQNDASTKQMHKIKCGVW